MTELELQQLDHRIRVLVAGDPEPERPAGAELTILDSGHAVYTAALARMSRRDGNTVWIRPIVGRVPSFDQHQPVVFSLNAARRRGLTVLGARYLDGGRIHLELAGGLTATIGPVTAAQAAKDLRDWDTFTTQVLTAAEEHELEQLREDSWWGRFA
jgi:hypothetical protein